MKTHRSRRWEAPVTSAKPTQSCARKIFNWISPGPSPATVHFTGVVQRVTFQGGKLALARGPSQWRDGVRDHFGQRSPAARCRYGGIKCASRSGAYQSVFRERSCLKAPAGFPSVWPPPALIIVAAALIVPLLRIIELSLHGDTGKLDVGELRGRAGLPRRTPCVPDDLGAEHDDFGVYACFSVFPTPSPWWWLRARWRRRSRWL